MICLEEILPEGTKTDSRPRKYWGFCQNLFV